MNPDPRARRLLDMLALSAPSGIARLTTAARREGFAKLMEMGARPFAIGRTHDLEMPGPDVRVRVYEPRHGHETPAASLIFFHGGGLVAGSIETHDGICRRLAMAGGFTVFSVGYRLAPEHRFPAALDDAARAVDWIATEASRLHIDASRIAVGGESAGALLAALICNGHRPVVMKPRAQLLLCPVIDIGGEFASRRDFADGYLIDRAIIARDVQDCLGPDGHAASMPSPLRHGDPARAPATVMVSAGCDPFRDEAACYAGHLSAAGVSVWHKCHAGMVHSFYGLSAFLPQADPALAEAAEVLAHQLG